MVYSYNKMFGRIIDEFKAPVTRIKIDVIEKYI